MIKNKYAVLSVDSNPDYLFFLPVSCAFWRKLGYNPYVILVEKRHITTDFRISNRI